MYLFEDIDATDESRVSNLAIFKVEQVGRRLKVVEYVDISTGEIISSKKAQDLGVSEIRPEAMLRRQKKLDSLRPEPRKLAAFLLKFRNRSGSFLTSIDTLIKWYSLYSGKRLDNVSKLVESLVEHEILDRDEGILSLNEDFILFNKNRTRVDVKSDGIRARMLFDIIMLEHRNLDLTKVS